MGPRGLWDDHPPPNPTHKEEVNKCVFPRVIAGAQANLLLGAHSRSDWLERDAERKPVSLKEQWP